MGTLLDRKDRMSMASGLEVRVPYADHRIVEYVFNAPWSYKNHNGENKALLRDAAETVAAGRHPHCGKRALTPKTHNPGYEKLLRSRLTEVMDDETEPLHFLVNESNVRRLMDEKSDYGKPWFGQLMAGPQMMAYLIEINYWLKKYEIKIEF